MGITFCIIDDDAVCRRILHNIIEDRDLGKVIGEANGGMDGIPLIIDTNPDVVLIDLLMKDQDGIEVIIELKEKGFIGKFIMISQIVNKEMVGQAYQAGIEFFIHKPINRVEVDSVLVKVKEQFLLNQSMKAIKLSLKNLDQMESNVPIETKEKSIQDVTYQILMNLGISGEIGSSDIIAIVEHVIIYKQDH